MDKIWRIPPNTAINKHNSLRYLKGLLKRHEEKPLHESVFVPVS